VKLYYEYKKSKPGRGYKGFKTAFNGITVWLQNFECFRKHSEHSKGDINKMWSHHKKLMVEFLLSEGYEINKPEKQYSDLLANTIQKHGFQKFTDYITKNYSNK
jgi:hypothetical protein